MTALTQYARLECPGLWRPDPGAQRQEVVVSFGDATLVIADKAGRALSHWSLAAVARVNPGQQPALYTPSAEQVETLEIDDDTMAEAIDTVQRAVGRTRAQAGRLRGWSTVAVVLALLAAGVFLLPMALVRHAAAVLPPAARAEIGAEVFEAMTRVAGQPCRSTRGDRALALLETRLMPAAGRLAVLPDAVTGTRVLPGGLVVLGRDLVEDHESPDVLAGHIVAAGVQRAARDPLAEVLRAAGPVAVARLLTRGHLPARAVQGHATRLAAAPAAPPPAPEALLPAFARAEIASTPYARARDITGETVRPLIDADPMRGAVPSALLSDADWLALQAICEE
ncbi:MAG: hypothetical protein V2I65_02170 [Paracoccaceae bacterium]|nr:hypothetical protein [Paracoccaceae bacterium]